MWFLTMWRFYPPQLEALYAEGHRLSSGGCRAGGAPAHRGCPAPRSGRWRRWRKERVWRGYRRRIWPHRQRLRRELWNVCTGDSGGSAYWFCRPVHVDRAARHAFLLEPGRRARTPLRPRRKLLETDGPEYIAQRTLSHGRGGRELRQCLGRGFSKPVL